MPAPFDRAGMTTGPDGIRRYDGLAQNLLHLLRDAVQAHPDREAVVELGGERVTYRDLWGRSARVAGGLRAARGRVRRHRLRLGVRLRARHPAP